MSVVVRMEMPDDCTCCPMCFTADVQGYHWCAALEQEVEQGLSRPKECPIICSLHEGHGRLVDADACASVLKKLENEAVRPTEKLCYGFAAKMFEEANAIVPEAAERSET